MPHFGIDAEGAYAHNIPTGTHTVGAYVTGSGQVPWTQAQIDMFHESGIERINQNNSINPRVGDVFDLEADAGTLSGLGQWAYARQRLGVESGVYVARGGVSDVESYLSARNLTHYYLHIADWNLDLEEATRLLGGRVRAIQFMSPSSNPNTLVPGSHLTLRQANVDVSICADDFFPPPHSVIVPSGVANAHVDVDLHSGRWNVQSLPGHVHLGVGGSGHWDVRSMPAEGDYWCAKVRIRRGH